VLKTALAVLAFVGLTLFSVPMSAQLIPHGNVYGGVSYGQFTNVVNTQSYRGWNGSAEAIPFARYPHIGGVVDVSGFYRNNATGKVTQYNYLGGVRLSATFGKFRPFAHVMGGLQHVNSSGIIYSHPALDFGGGLDYKLFFKNFSWRVQGDYVRTHYSSANQNAYRASTGIVWRF
jgi:hypothetical protein